MPNSEYLYLDSETSRFRRGVKEIKGNPNFLIKSFGEGFKSELGALESTIKKTKGMYSELESVYNIRLAPYEFVIGTRENWPKNNGYGADIFIQRIEGKNLQEINEVPNEAVQEAKDLIANLLNYFKNKYKNKQEIFADIYTPDQFVYGVRPNETEKHIYLVDLPFRTASDYKDPKKYDFLYELQYFLDFCESLEGKNKNISLTDSKQEISQLIADLEK